MQWPPLDVSSSAGRGVGYQVNKFREVSSDDHTMSVAGGRVSLLTGGGLPLACDLSHDACEDATLTNPPPLSEQTHACESNTFPQILLRAVITSLLAVDRYGLRNKTFDVLFY